MYTHNDHKAHFAGHYGHSHRMDEMNNFNALFQFIAARETALSLSEHTSFSPIGTASRRRTALIQSWPVL